jgi:hypothetical protein
MNMVSSFSWMAPQEAITEFLDGYTAHWPRVAAWPYYNPAYWQQPLMAHQTTPEAIAEELIANAQFRALQLGTWLNRPDVELITAAVQAITPPPYGQDIELLVEALKLAAQAQRRDGWRHVLLTTTGAAAGLGVLLAAGRE